MRKAKELKKKARRNRTRAIAEGCAGICVLECARAMHRVKGMGEAVMLMPCQHACVCQRCVHTLVRVQWRCPLCRAHAREAWLMGRNGQRVELLCTAPPARPDGDSEEADARYAEHVAAQREHERARRAEDRAQARERDREAEQAEAAERERRCAHLQAWLQAHDACVRDAFARLGAGGYQSDWDVGMCLSEAGEPMRSVVADWNDPVHRVALRRILRTHMRWTR